MRLIVRSSFNPEPHEVDVLEGSCVVIYFRTGRRPIESLTAHWPEDFGEPTWMTWRRPDA